MRYYCSRALTNTGLMEKLAHDAAYLRQGFELLEIEVTRSVLVKMLHHCLNILICSMQGNLWLSFVAKCDARGTCPKAWTCSRRHD